MQNYMVEGSGGDGRRGRKNVQGVKKKGENYIIQRVNRLKMFFLVYELKKFVFKEIQRRWVDNQNA